ncbi:conserved Plasmodium protein, unknown function [Plasmodium sp. DRC-Itaito]|nr:conserved Plasmodium protein, unknown function [Plasmodium sp. DRC-Itaito]
MNYKDSHICVLVKFISFGCSNFCTNKIEENFCDDDEINEIQKDDNDIYAWKLKNLIGNVFIGKVLYVGNNFNNILKGKDVIGIFTLNSKIHKDNILVPYHDVIEYTNIKMKNDEFLCATFRLFYESYICLSVIKNVIKENYIAIFTHDIIQILPFLKLLIIQKYTILIFLSKDNFNQSIIQKKLEEFHITKESIEKQISLFSIDMNIPEHVHNITNKLGIKTILIYPNINIDINILKKYIFTISALNANIIFTYQVDYLNPHECKLLYNKGITIHFFNITNYVHYDYFKRVDAFNYILLSILNKDIDIPQVSINKKYFTNMDEILSSSFSSIETYNVYVNKNLDDEKDHS